MKINKRIRKKRLRNKFLKGASRIGNRRLSCKRIGRKLGVKGVLFKSTVVKHTFTLLDQHDVKFEKIRL